MALDLATLVAPAHTALVLQEVQNGVVGEPSALPALIESTRLQMIRFNPFMYCTVGRKAELERGMAGQDPALFQRMLAEIAEYVRFADDAGYAGWGHP